MLGAPSACCGRIGGIVAREIRSKLHGTSNGKLESKEVTIWAMPACYTLITYDTKPVRQDLRNSMLPRKREKGAPYCERICARFDRFARDLKGSSHHKRKHTRASQHNNPMIQLN